MQKKRIVINDYVHHHIDVPSLCRAVMDTPQFDRLRSIRQLGTVHYVFPCAQHSRWEHSVGVMHLAGQLVDHLRNVHPGCADERDKLCVMLAGLCHDLGHGPLSHFWEEFLREARPDFRWIHEQTSCDMLDFLIEDNNLLPVFKDNGLSEEDILFIKEMINGPSKGDSTLTSENNDKKIDYPYVGRGPEKYFLYEIVANKISSLDVDKWDYIMRDNKAINIPNCFNPNRILTFIGLIDQEGLKRLAVRDKESDTLMEMYEDRAKLHKKCFQHRVVKVLDRMVLDALLKADKVLNVLKDDQGQNIRISEACEDVKVFCDLTDEYLLQTIKLSRDPNLAEASYILRRISSRNLYKTLVFIQYPGGKSPLPFLEMESELRVRVEQSSQGFNPQDIVLTMGKINLGMGNKNPMKKCLFFDKDGKQVKYSKDMIRERSLENGIQETIQVVYRKDLSKEKSEKVESELNTLGKIIRDWLNLRFQDILEDCYVKFY